MMVSKVSGKYKVVVSATPDLNNTRIYLLSHTRQIIKNSQSSVINDGNAIFTLDPNDLGEGISVLTILDGLGHPLAERLVFKRPVNKLMVGAKPDQIIYGSRRPVNIDLTTINSGGMPVEGNLSMSVFLIDSLQRIPEQNIATYLYLTSELKGRIENPEYYFNDSSNASVEAMDNLLLTQGWRRFKWNDVFAYKHPPYEFLPELEGPVVTGKIVGKLTGIPVAKSDALISVPGADYAFNCATSDAQGIIRFAFKNIFNNNAIVVQPAQAKDSVNRIDINNAFSDKFSTHTPTPLKLLKANESELLNLSLSDQVENTYALPRKRLYFKYISDTTSFYGAPDKLYYLDDYTRFQTMEEVLREYVEDVRVRKEGDKFNFKVRNKLFGTYFDQNPLILIDGIPVSDASRVIALDPLKVKKVEIVTHRYFVGSASFDGIVNVKSYDGELGTTQIDPNALVIEFEGLQRQREFYSPVYASKDDQDNHLPDFRNVLFWTPKIITDASGRAHINFYTSDLKGKYAVVVQGITANGIPGKGTAQFEVTAD
jgi:hypothetical protein